MKPKTIGEYLRNLGDSDADRVADGLDREVFDCPLDSAVGEHCQTIAEATLVYIAAIELTVNFESEELRWNVWWQARLAMTIAYFG